MRKAALVLTAWLIALPMCGAPVAAAADASLLDLLRRKQVLSEQEYERLKGTQLSPTQRTDLIELLRDKGVLTKEEAARLEHPEAPAAQQVAEEKPKQPLPAAAAASPQLGYDEGFFVRTADGTFTLKFTGRVASNFFFTEPGTLQNDSETIDRGRLGVDATVYKYFRMRLENDFAFSSGLRDAFIAFNYLPEFNVQLGQYKVPFSYEELLSKKYIDFVERSAAVNSTVNPSRDIGIMVYGAVSNKLLQYQLAGMNGAGQNRSDNNSDKDVVGRLVVAPFVNAGPDHLKGLNFGGAVTYGHQPIETASGTTVTKSSIAGTTEATAMTGFTFFPAVERHGERLRTGGHIAWLDGPYSLSAEYIHTDEARSDAKGVRLPDLDTDGAYAGGTWMLTGERKPFNARVRPARPLLDAKVPGWGAWEAALRYEFFQLRHGPDSAQDRLTDNRYDAVAAGMNWYPNEFVRFSLNYLYGNFDNRGNGRSPNPDKHSNNAVLGRAQLEF